MAGAQTLVDVEGVVKWFDARKGFGFIVGPEGQDIFVHFSVIEQSEGFRALRDGERVNIVEREMRLRERLLDNRRDTQDMLARCHFGIHTAIPRVDFHLRSDN